MEIALDLSICILNQIEGGFTEYIELEDSEDSILLENGDHILLER